MSLSVETQIQECEERLKVAMLQSDILVLDKLLSDDLTFTNHMGHIMTKQDDIEAHKSKALNIKEITLSNQLIKTYDNIAIVTVMANIIGCFEGKESVNNFRFTRVWNKTSSKIWQITTSHSSIVN